MRAYYNEGIEIEVDTLPSERRKYLATIACSALILKCMEESLYPSWDAPDIYSVRLAEKLGYRSRLESLIDSTNSEEKIRLHLYNGIQ
ncbi:MAG: GNAT family N-acetyltransferase [Lachnospiraceae bacterium]